MKVEQLLQDDRFPCFRECYALASDGHKYQKRKDGKPYMSHIGAVIELTYEGVSKRCIYDEAKDLALSLAAVHDLIEDQPDYSFEDVTDIIDRYYKKDLPVECIEFKDGLCAITKKEQGTKNYTNYVDYVTRVKNNFYARFVKIADLKHNMSDLSTGNLREKYELTLFVLEN